MTSQERMFKINEVIWTTKSRAPAAFSEKNVENVDFFVPKIVPKNRKNQRKSYKKVESSGKKRLKQQKMSFFSSIFNSSVSKLAKWQSWQ